MAAYSEILFEDNHLIAVNKIGGALVQADRTNDAILPDEIKNYLKTKYDKPGNVYLGTVHRIDRPVPVWYCSAEHQKQVLGLVWLLEKTKSKKLI
jgi:23S rRNA pseudouridine1911/1915/1917 synthase